MRGCEVTSRDNGGDPLGLRCRGASPQPGRRARRRARERRHRQAAAGDVERHQRAAGRRARAALPPRPLPRGALPREDVEGPRVVHGRRTGRGRPPRGGGCPIAAPGRLLDGRSRRHRHRRGGAGRGRARPRPVDPEPAAARRSHRQAARRRPRGVGPLPARGPRGQSGELAGGVPAGPRHRHRGHLRADPARAARRRAAAPLRCAAPPARLAGVGRPHSGRAPPLRGVRAGCPADPGVPG